MQTCKKLKKTQQISKTESDHDKVDIDSHQKYHIQNISITHIYQNTNYTKSYTPIQPCQLDVL
jgi:hypothetical protein